MKIANASIYDIASLMGSIATEAEAAHMIDIMTAAGITDTNEITDNDFSEWIAEAAARAAADERADCAE